MTIKCLLLFALFTNIFACKQPNDAAENQTAKIINENSKIVSLTNVTTEILCALGYEKNIVGVDVTSTYPESIMKLPKVGYNRAISVEGVLSLQPDLIVGTTNLLTDEQIATLKKSHAKVLLFDHKYSKQGAVDLIKNMSETLLIPSKGDSIISVIENDFKCLKPLTDSLTVLFLYARGAGSISVAGQGAQTEEIIKLAGGKNPNFDFKDFKPLSPEVLVASDPDVVLMFESGMSSVSGPEGLLNVPGMAATTAGKNKSFITMDGVLLSGYGPRVGKAACLLNERLLAIKKD